jgi:hypothetical protein
MDMFTSNANKELLWRFSNGRTIAIPVCDWIKRGETPVSVDSIDIKDSVAIVAYANGGIRVEIANTVMSDSSVSQKIDVRFTRALDDVLIDIRFRPDNPGALRWLTIPALFYGDNNLTADLVIYPRGIDRQWSLRADGASCPGIHFPGAEYGYAVFMENDRMRVSRSGVDGKAGVEEPLAGVGWLKRGETGFTARFTCPCQETPNSYHAPERLLVPIEGREKFSAGDIVTFKARHFITGAGKQAYFAPVRAMAEANRPATLDGREDELAETARLFAQCLRDSHFIEGRGFSHRQDLPEVHSGWCGGLSVVEAGLLYGESAGDAKLYKQAETMADFISATALSPAGYFNAEYRDGVWHPRVYWGKAFGLHLRHASEGCLFLSRALVREAGKGRTRDAWWAALKSNLDAVCRDQRPDGSLPIEVDPVTGEALDWDGATPGSWAGALAAGSALASERGDAPRAERYRAAALRAGDYYLEQYVSEDVFYGGPYDAFRAPNMEDPYNLLNSYAELYRHTGEARFLEAAKICADHLLSWRYTYDVIFPKGTICEAQRVSTYAMAPASVRNRHIQNWDTVAALALFDLTAWTGDPAYARSARDNLVQSCQLVERGDGALGIPMGGQSEQWYATEFFWFGSFGDYGKGNLWKVSIALPKSGFLSAVAQLGVK